VGDASPRAAQTATVAATPAPFLTAPLPPPSARPASRGAPCKVSHVSGRAYAATSVRADAGAGPLLLPDAEVPGGGWLDVARQSRVVLVDPRTTRETTFHGPGRARACVRGEEEAWVLAGTFEATGGSGEAPGNEQWVVTPLGVVRYAVGNVQVSVARESAFVKVDRGWVSVAVILPAKPSVVRRPLDAGDSDEAVWARLDAGQSLTLAFPDKQTDLQRAHEAFDHCVRAARRARTFAQQLAAPDAAVGELTARHVAARRLARAACAVAELRAETLGPADRATRLEKIREANEEWAKLGP